MVLSRAHKRQTNVPDIPHTLSSNFLWNVSILKLCQLMHILPWFVYNRIFQLTFFVVMYRYGVMVINLARRSYCDAGVCIVYIDCLRVYVFVYLCFRSPISQYGPIVTKLYIEKTSYICWIPGEAFWKYTGGGLHWHIKNGGLNNGHNSK